MPHLIQPQAGDAHSTMLVRAKIKDILSRPVAVCQKACEGDVKELLDRLAPWRRAGKDEGISDTVIVRETVVGVLAARKDRNM